MIEGDGNDIRAAVLRLPRLDSMFLWEILSALRDLSALHQSSGFWYISYIRFVYLFLGWGNRSLFARGVGKV